MKVLLVMGLGWLGISDFGIAGWQNDPRLAEFSGLTTSLSEQPAERQRMWAINDGGQPPELFALSLSGEILGTVAVAGVSNIDWEDIDAFRLEGKRYLAIADVGDNAAVRDSVQIHVVREPGAPEGSVRPSWTLSVRYPDGARDSEGIAVDAESGWIYLVDKRIVPASLYRLRLRPEPASLAPDGSQFAERVGSFSGIPEPHGDGDANDFVRYANQPTALDLSCNGLEMALLTYAAIYRYRRAPDESWATALARKPLRDALPPITQAEALSYSRRCRYLYIGSEKPPVPILKLDLR